MCPLWSCGAALPGAPKNHLAGGRRGLVLRVTESGVIYYLVLLAFSPDLFLAFGQISVHFLEVRENAHAWQGGDNLKYLLDLWLQMDKRYLAASLVQSLAGKGEKAQSGAADKLELRQVENNFARLAIENLSKLLFELRCGGGIEGSSQTYGCG